MSETELPSLKGRPLRHDLYEFDASRDRYSYALNDLKRALANPRLISSVVLKSFSGRYQRTSLGPFWLTISTAMTVGGLAVLYGKIFGSPLSDYFPYVGCGIIVWGLVSSIFNGAAGAFSTGAATFDQIPIAKSIFAFRVLGSSFLAFMYKLPVLFSALVLVGRTPGVLSIFVALCGLGLVLWTGFWCTLVLGTIGLRFKDTAQAISAIMSAVFFFTPVFWQADRLREYAFIVDLNPFYHYIHIIRGPLLGYDGVAHSFIWAVGCATLMTIAGATVYGMFARRFSYWS
ncbi:ABC transporter permease [Parvularcula sp. LCG005]|uniref:ABC transporter permease n=1 Tax=Parvularcula sp. LCG005 TaxID=3078805 RepID=UPI002941FB99|nr:ABC transporter permease [Parvularcula sp. LCG005]WOI53618.1 ABC transporter permease [Parvularcula sp. LCG005]